MRLRRSAAPTRLQTGTTTEFAVAFTLVLAVTMAVINICFLPVRYLFCQAVMSELADTAGHCEKLSDANKLVKQDASWKARLASVGVTISKEELILLATTSDGKGKLRINAAQAVPDEWLPGNSKGPFIYSVILQASCTIAPAVHSKDGLFGPVTIPVRCGSQWENISLDPKSSKYFLQE